MEPKDWTVVFRGGPPRDWQRAARSIVAALASPRFTPGDANRAVRLGQGFVNLLLDADEATAVEKALSAAGFEARGLRWLECEAAEPPRRVTRVDFEAAEAIAGLPWERVQVVHTAIAESAAVFLPPDASKATKTTHRLASAVSVAATVFGVEDFGVSAAVSQGTGQLLEPGTPGPGRAELVVELLGLWAPRVQLVVDTFEYGAVPGALGLGRRQRLAKLLEAVLHRAKNARAAGATEQALRAASLEGLEPVPAAEHKRLVMAWLTSERLWPRAG